MALLELEDVDAYYDASQVLFDLSLSVEENDIVTLLGRNGAGKTTTLRSIMGATVTRREGAITYGGADLLSLSTDEVSNRGVKLVPEERRIFPTLSVHENLQVAHDLATDPREIGEMYDIFPVLGDLQESAGQNLSGGEQQMLSVARALVQNPDVLLLDEPTEGLAPVIVDDLREVFADVVQRDLTVLLTEQNVDFALDLAEHCYIIEKGTNAWEGSVDDLREREELLDEYLAVSVGEAD